MAFEKVLEIERAIGTLTPHEWEELCVWLDDYMHPVDTRIQSDLAAGRLDKAIQQALADEKNDRLRPL